MVVQRRPELPPTRRSDRRQAGIVGDAPWLLHAVTLSVFGVAFQVAPELVDASAIALALPEWATRIWALGLLIGAGLVILGALIVDARYDVAGDLALAAWATTYGYAVFAVRGALTGTVALALFSAYGVLCVSRAVILRFEPQVLEWHSRRRRC